MIVVKIELWPMGFESRAVEIGRATVTLDSKTTSGATQGDYSVILSKSSRYAKQLGVWRRGRVEGFPRKRLGPYDLVLRALAACVAGRNGTREEPNPFEGLELGDEPGEDS